MKNKYATLCLLMISLLRAEDVKSSDQQTWEIDRSFFCDNEKSCKFHGSLPSINKKNILKWKDGVKSLPYYKVLDSIFLNHCHIRDEHLDYLCEFPNITDFTLGISIEGVLVSMESLKHLKKLQKLKSLSIAIHGLNDAHFDVITKIPNLEYLTIAFPSVNMIPDADLRLWSKTEITDQTASKIARMKSLKGIYFINSPGKNDGEVAFTADALEALLKLPNLKELVIDSGNFSDENLRKIKILKLPPTVRIQ